MRDKHELLLPVYLRPFLKTNLSSKDKYFILGKPFVFNLSNTRDSSARTTKAFAFVYNYNFFIGSTWGLLSGMSSGSFFQPDKFSSKILAMTEGKGNKYTTNSLTGASYLVSRASVFTWRVGARTSLCVIFFEILERNIREPWDKWWKSINARSNHSKIDCGYLFSIPITTTATSLLFPVHKSFSVSAIFGFCMVSGLTLGLLYYHRSFMKRFDKKVRDRLKPKS